MKIFVFSQSRIFSLGIVSIMHRFDFVDEVSNVKSSDLLLKLAGKNRGHLFVIHYWEEPHDFLYIIERIREISPSVKILVLADDVSKKECLENIAKAQPNGVIETASDDALIKAALLGVEKDGIYLSAAVQKSLMHFAGVLVKNRSYGISPAVYEGFTHREKEIFALINKGHTNAEIASLLGISVNTVHNHIVNLNRKLGAKNQRRKRSAESGGDKQMDAKENPNINTWMYDPRYTISEYDG